jgi:uncharacterized protein YjbI with pentapeptide repeats
MADNNSPEAFAQKANDLGELRSAVVDAASVGAGLWLSYLFVFFYLAIAAAGINHRDLFFENPVKLPFISVDLPLLGFFVIGPLLFLVVHAYVLLHFVMLADKVGVFHEQLNNQIHDDDVQARLRRQLPSNIFVQLLAGPPEFRSGVMGLTLRLIAWITLLIGPLALLAFFQLQFLPYHSSSITWLHRFAVLLDLSLLWTLWPSIARGETAWLRWRDLRRVKVWLAGLASLVPVLLVLTVATIPGEALEDNLPSFRFLPATAEGGEGGLRSLHEFFIAGDINLVARRPTSLWSNILVLPGLDPNDRLKSGSDETKLSALLDNTLSLRGRRLEGAVLIGAQLRKADFTGARLAGAYLDDADLREAKFDCANRRQRDDHSEQCANLQGASLIRARLQGASLRQARLDGASLIGARLEGASLLEARLDAASLLDAQLQGAALDRASLRGAFLWSANLEGASFIGAAFQGVMMSRADLQGVDLRGAVLDGASISDALVWRADVRHANGTPAVKDPVLDAKAGSPECARSRCESSPATFAALRKRVEAAVPAGLLRDLALKRISRLDPDVPLADQGAIADAWTALAKSSPPNAVHEKSRADVWRETVCRADNAPTVVDGLRNNLESIYLPSELAAIFLNPTSCPGARGISKEVRDYLRWVRDQKPPFPIVTPP